jgi:hypothetical protein
VDTAGGWASLWPMTAALVADIPLARLDELFQLWTRNQSGAFRSRAAAEWGLVLAGRGRPRAAESVWEHAKGPDLITADQWRMMLALSGMGAGLDTIGAYERLSGLSLPAHHPARCEPTLWRLRTGTATPDDATVSFSATCGRTLAITRIPLDSGARTVELLENADSLTRNIVLARGYELAALARAWERVGRPDRALQALRYQNPANRGTESVWLLPEEARLALAVGDTAGAVRAIEYWLPIVADAEPPVAAERDRLRALLTRLKQDFSGRD